MDFNKSVSTTYMGIENWMLKNLQRHGNVLIPKKEYLELKISFEFLFGRDELSYTHSINDSKFIILSVTPQGIKNFKDYMDGGVE